MPTADTNSSLSLTLRGRILALLISLSVLAAWLTGDYHARLAASLLMAPMLVDLLFKGRGLRDVSLRPHALRTQAGLPFLEVLEVRGGRRILRDLSIVEPRMATYTGGAIVETLGPARPVKVRLHSRSRRRGHARSRTFELETRYPFGFLSSHAEISVPAELITEPARTELPPTTLLSLQRGELEPWDNDRLGGWQFHSLREYTLGEDARAVHALRSASIGTLVRKEFRGQQQRQAWIVLDLRRPPGRLLHLGARRLEWSLSACASLLDILTGSGVLVRCLAIDTHDRHWTIDSHQDGLDFLAFLAVARPVQHRQLGPELLNKFRRGQVYWFPAGGCRATADIEALGADATLVGAEP